MTVQTASLRRTGAETALTVTSGLLAGQLAVNFLKNYKNEKGLKPVFIYAPSAHPAVWEAPPAYLFNNQDVHSWHGRKESNPHYRFWRPMFYH